MAAEDAGGSGDLAILVNTEMIVLKGAVKAVICSLLGRQVK